MTGDVVGRVRGFNRFYTGQIGVLTEHLLHSEYSLTEVRVLFEIDHRGSATAAAIAQDLGLDRGYMSRIVARFRREGMIRRAASPDDARVRVLSLTAKGRRVFCALDARSNEDVASLLRRVSPKDQRRLLAAMRTIEDILARPAGAKSAFTLRDPRPGDFGWVIHRHGALYSQEYHYDERFEALVAKIVGEFADGFDPKRERCWIAEKDGEPVGSVFCVRLTDAVAKLRLLYVEPSARGLGIGERLVAECVSFARLAGYRKMTLWTQSDLFAARHLYQKAGFALVKSEPNPAWSRDDLVSETWEMAL
jgi:DNA-binding MarR family transcriptional regulator/N-acetylglutamate synthase-like GNAT family acetyltransferase